MIHNKRIEEMDILRGVAILSVILIHISSSFFGESHSGLSNGIILFINQASRFAVPIFIILSGWGLTITKKYSQKYLNFLVGQISKIFGMYLVWNLIYFAFSNQNINLINLTKGILLGTSYYHLYYVPVILILYIFYPIIYNISRTNIGLIFFLLITLISQYYGVYSGISVLTNPLNIFNWIFYFSFGIWFAENFKVKVAIIKTKVSLLLTLFFILLIFVILECYINLQNQSVELATTSMRPSVILFSLAFMFLAIGLKWNFKSLKAIFIYLANASYGMYLSHVLVLEFYKLLITKLGINFGVIWFVFSAFLIVTPISLLISIIMDKGKKSVKEYLNTFSKQLES
ncbi:acyltransferase [Rossellomorea sp. RS05]|uniref:acyltransferase n=1 Tax=Rossellomorea sp. RS05 TaxID=3149166 RepID=UPI00322188C5